METISIPSPSSFLKSPILQTSLPPKPSPKTQAKRQSAATKSFQKSGNKDGITKPKQSKSRNGMIIFLSIPHELYMLMFILGCVTCKQKRLKCDEGKPSCQQCHRRNVTCEGYKKDFKWRAFEEATFTTKPIPSPKAKKGRCHLHNYSAKVTAYWIQQLYALMLWLSTRRARRILMLLAVQSAMVSVFPSQHIGFLHHP